jgi:hypothetical protein
MASGQAEDDRRRDVGRKVGRYGKHSFAEDFHGNRTRLATGGVVEGEEDAPAAVAPARASPNGGGRQEPMPLTVASEFGIRPRRMDLGG